MATLSFGFDTSSAMGKKERNTLRIGNNYQPIEVFRFQQQQDIV